MDKNPAYNRQGNGAGKTAGKKPSGAAHVHACRNKSNHIHGNEQNGADKSGNLLRGHFFHRNPSFLHVLFVQAHLVSGTIFFSYFIMVFVLRQCGTLLFII